MVLNYDQAVISLYQYDLCGSFYYYLCWSLPYSDVCFLQACGHRLRKGLPLSFLVCDVLLCFCHFPIRSPGSGVVLDCIDS